MRVEVDGTQYRSWFRYQEHMTKTVVKEAPGVVVLRGFCRHEVSCFLTLGGQKTGHRPLGFWVGASSCSPKDRFVKTEGRELAFLRALVQTGMENVVLRKFLTAYENTHRVSPNWAETVTTILGLPWVHPNGWSKRVDEEKKNDRREESFLNHLKDKGLPMERLLKILTDYQIKHRPTPAWADRVKALGVLKMVESTQKGVPVIRPATK